MRKKDYTIKVKYNKKLDDYFLELPDKLLKKLNWKVGDILNFIANKDGSFTITK